MKLLNKVLLAILAVVVVGSGIFYFNHNKKSEAPKTETKTEKTEYITEITKDNVEEVIIEYKEVLSYYNDLKNNLKTLSDVSKNSDLESDAITAKDSIKNGSTLLASVKPRYKPLEEAKSTLVKMYSVSESMADNVVSNPDKYKTNLEEYDKLFKSFKKQMDDIRKDIEKVRGKSTTDEKKDDKVTEVDEKNATKQDDSSSSNKDSNREDSKNTDKNTSSNRESDRNDDRHTSRPPRSSSGSSSSDAGSSSPDDNGATIVPKVSSLNNSIRNEIKSAGYSAGSNFKQSGGTEAQIDQTAGQLFDDLEGDNPIQGSQRSEARAIFISAFRAAFYSN